MVKSIEQQRQSEYVQQKQRVAQHSSTTQNFERDNNIMMSNSLLNQHPASPVDSSSSSEQPFSKRRCKAVSFSYEATMRRVNVADSELKASWLTDKEVSFSKKRAKKLSKFHYLKTHPDDDDALSKADAPPPPNNRAGIVYNCHPAHYEIIGESLRGMEHITDTFTARARERLRSDTISLIEQHYQQFQDAEAEEADIETARSTLACKYRESTKEAMIYAKAAAEEDAKVAARILAEDLNQQDDDNDRR